MGWRAQSTETHPRFLRRLRVSCGGAFLGVFRLRHGVCPFPTLCLRSFAHRRRDVPQDLLRTVNGANG